MPFKKPAAFLAAAALLVSLSACSGDSSGSGGKVTLTVWDPALLTHLSTSGKLDAKTSFMQAAAVAYEKRHPNVKVNVVQTSGDITKSSAQFQAASIAGNGPDIRVGFTGGNTDSYARFLLDLSSTFSPATMKDLSGWNTVRLGYKPNGKLLALPYGAGSYFYVFYNKKLAAQAGLDLTTPPKSWEDLIALGQQVKSKTKLTPFFIANQEGYPGAWIVAALVGGQLGSNAFTEMYNGNPSIDDPAVRKAYAAYAQLHSAGVTNNDASSTPNANQLSGFAQGKSVFTIAGDWDNADLYKSMGDNVGVFPIPTLQGSKYPTAVAGGPNEAISITNYSSHQSEAKDFLRFLAEPSTIDMYVKMAQKEASNSAKADLSVITNPLLKSEAPAIKAADAKTFPFDNIMPQPTIDLFYKVNAGVFTGTVTPASAAQQLEAEFKKDKAGQ
ncbi:extracellular solute-binding protein [Amnibacterium sp. CER49]|uniref:ABC transporter substrate-binding protein n=1 Tax=Amnibacterium sp. CER49 TaxID=3039161 RepID=UPI00244CC7F3|nr:extracellular solute-binding protein [Amnibacterium sp. CER49]MDH2444098.1 extracellular solute-binding protein [Amnibacterium sp. CER49]